MAEGIYKGKAGGSRLTNSKSIGHRPESMEETLKPKPDRQAKINKHTKVNPDADYKANVQGSLATRFPT